MTNNIPTGYNPPNKALYLVVALIVLFITTLAAITFVSYRVPNNQEVIIGGVLAFAGTAITSLLSMLVSLNVSEGVSKVNDKVNGTLTTLAEQNAKLAQSANIAHSQTEVALAQAAGTVIKPDIIIDKLG